MNTKTMEQFNVLSVDTLATVEGGKGGFSWPIPSYRDLLSSICGLADGLKGRKHKGSC